ncbi:MAG: uncharacterized protein PWP51_1573 [Clostridiales bacterium]|jgi:predicted aldo/keto reductase-like oxidoreductase|nr:uncharacterized protein [Clostridiales bacterium]MDN5299020.1 uncharacterized protein [Clostridiales bacterium]
MKATFNEKKLGFGFMRLPLLDAKDPKSVDMTMLCEMVDAYLAAGFNYFDTAYMYHGFKSEIFLKKALVERHPRDTFTVASKLPTMQLKEAADMPRIFAEQLEKCGVSYFDYYLLHNLNVENCKIASRLDAYQFIQEKKAEGTAKYIGFSYHDQAPLLDEILTAYPFFDFVQLQINYLDWDNESVQSRKCYEVATKHGVPVVVMEPVKGGILANVPEVVSEHFKAASPDKSTASWAIRYAASPENVKMVLSGMSDLDQLKDNMSFMNDFKPLDETETALVEQAVSIMNETIAVPCTACQYCVDDCPQQIPIPNYFALYNSRKMGPQDGFSILNVYYANMAKNNGKASECIACGKCEKSCPQHIEIIEHLKAVAATFE